MQTVNSNKRVYDTLLNWDKPNRKFWRFLKWMVKP